MKKKSLKENKAGGWPQASLIQTNLEANQVIVNAMMRRYENLLPPKESEFYRGSKLMRGFKTARTRKKDGIYDNHCTMRRERWKKGKLVDWIDLYDVSRMNAAMAGRFRAVE